MQKYSILYIALTLCVFSNLSLFAQEITNSLIENEKRHFEGFLLHKQSNVGQNIDVKYHRFEWYIDPNIYYIKGNVTTYFTAGIDNLEQITLDFNETLEIDSVVSVGEHLPHSVDGYILTIDLNTNLQINKLDSLTIYYQGAPPDDSGFGSFDQSQHYDGPIIWTLSEPYGAKDWWPCKQDLNDKIDSVDIIVTSPAAYKAASNGVLIRDEVLDTVRVSHWRHRHPIAAYLVAIAVTNYDVYEDEVILNSGDKIDLVNYLYPGYVDDFDGRMQELKNIITFFSDIFIDYPFKDEKYGHAQFGWGGGMEHQTMSFMGNLGYYLTAHELAHQWFGDYITCGSWAEIWLNEGFARYSEGLVMEEFSPNDFPGWRESKISYIVGQPDGSVYVDDTTSVSRIFSRRLTYEKAGMVLHMLRREIGDAAFFNAIKAYLNDPAIANGYASTSQLKNHFETAADTNLTEFFDDWIYGEGHPSFHVGWDQSNENLVSITLQQTPSHISVDLFECKVELKLIGEFMDTTFVVHQTENNQTFYLDPGFDVTELQFDPNHHLVAGQAVINFISSIEKEKLFQIVPNPAYDFIQIKNKSNIYIESAAIIGIRGNVLYEQKVYSNQNELSFEIQQLAQGTYFVKIKPSGQNYLFKFIKKD